MSLRPSIYLTPARSRRVEVNDAAQNDGEPCPVALDVLQPVIDAIEANVTILDQDGFIVAVNESWRDIGRLNGLMIADAGIGVHYLDLCRHIDAPVPDAAMVEPGLRSVMSGAVHVHE